jgi:hypothetical protein
MVPGDPQISRMPQIIAGEASSAKSANLPCRLNHAQQR